MKKISLNISFLLISVTILNGCATPRFTGKYSPVYVDEKLSDKVISKYENTDIKTSASVPVLWKEKDYVHQGIILNRSDIKNSKFDTEQLEFLGYVHSVAPKPSTQKLNSNWWFNDFHESESGRDIYCKIQAPFKILTLSLWSYLPLNWPCYVEYTDLMSKETFTELHTENLKKLTLAAGGDISVVVNEMPFQYQYGSILGGTLAVVTSAVFKVKKPLDKMAKSK